MVNPMNAFEQLHAHPWFAKLTLEQFAALAALARRETFAPGQSMVHQGDLGNRFFFIESGAVNLHRTDASGVEAHVGIVPSPSPADAPAPPLNYFGEQMFTSQAPYDFHANALTETLALVITREDFDAFLQTQSEIRAALTFLQDAEKERTRGFRWIAPGENVAVVARKHWWALLPSLTPVLVVFIALVVVDFLVGIFLHLDILNWGLTAFAALSFAWLAYTVFEWFNDEYVVTNQRVVHVEREMIFNLTQKGIPLDKILNVRVDLAIPSVWFGVGSLVIQTAGREGGDIAFSHVAKPVRIRAEILAQKDRIRARQAAEEREKFRERVRSELASFVAPQLVPPAAQTPPRPLTKPSVFQAFRRSVRGWLSLEIYTPEQVTWRKHWFLLFRKTARWFAALVFLDLCFLSYAFDPRTRILGGGAYLLGGIAAFSLCFAALLWNWVDWKNDIYAVTTTSVIHEERLPFNLRTVSNVAPLDQVQDIRLDVPGVVAAWLNYGNVIVETAGKGGQMVFEMVRNPRHIQEEIFRRIEAFRVRRIEQEASLRNRSVVDALIAYHHLQQQLKPSDSQPAAPPPEEAKPPDDSIPPFQRKPGP